MSTPSALDGLIRIACIVGVLFKGGLGWRALSLLFAPARIMSLTLTVRHGLKGVIGWECFESGEITSGGVDKLWW